MKTVKEQIEGYLIHIRHWLTDSNVVGLHVENIVGHDTPAIIVSVINARPDNSQVVTSFDLPQEVTVLISSSTDKLGEVKVPVIVKETGPVLVQSLNSKERPCPGGYQITVDDKYGVGTLGVNINYKGKYCLLSNAHVIAPLDSYIGRDVYQPEEGMIWQNSFCKVSGRVSVVTYPINNPPSPIYNTYDFAWAEIETAKGSPEIYSIGVPTGFRDPVDGERIWVVGAKTGILREANIASIAAMTKLDFFKGQYAFFEKSIRLDSLVTAPGDSGAVYVAASDRKIVGINFAGNSTNSYGCLIP